MPTHITKIQVTTMTTTTRATAMVTTSFWLLLLVGDVLRQCVFQASTEVKRAITVRTS
jgi:hypothetical protein